MAEQIKFPIDSLDPAYDPDADVESREGGGETTPWYYVYPRPIRVCICLLYALIRNEKFEVSSLLRSYFD